MGLRHGTLAVYFRKVPGVCFAVAVCGTLGGIKERRAPVETTAGGNGGEGKRKKGIEKGPCLI